MKTKHRRLFGHNNRKAIHFSYLSAAIAKNLWRLTEKFCLTLLTTCALVQVPATVMASDSIEQQIDDFISQAIYSRFPDSSVDDIMYSANFPAALLEQKSCDSPLSFDWRGELNAGANTLNAACADPNWQVYIPISLQVFKEVVVALEPLDRNRPIRATQLATTRMDIGGLRMGYFSEPTLLAGYELQRTVKTGQVITPYIAKAPPLVKRGDWVTIISGGGGLTVTSTGEALKDGVLGDQIPEKNLKTENRIRAWIIQKGVVSTKK